MNFILFSALLILLLPLTVNGRVLMLREGTQNPGELGYLMGGAQTALTSGGESLWYNPAGLARREGAQLTGGGVLLHLQMTGTEEAADSRWGGGPGNLSFFQTLTGPNRFPRFAYGLALAVTTSDRLPFRVRDERQRGGEALPPGLGDPVTVDGLFPEGFQIVEISDGLGELTVLSSSAGFGVALAEWVRLGMAVHLERIQLSQQSTTLLEMSGQGQTTTTNTLSGQSLSSRLFEGEADRYRLSFGVQMEFWRGIIAGLSLSQASRTLGGSGRVSVAQGGRLTINAGGTTTNQPVTVINQGENLPFELRSPQVLQIGVAFVSDWMLVEFDLASIKALPSYEVFPAIDSGPPSTIAFRLPAQTSSGQRGSRAALGLAFAQNDRTSWVAGLVSTQSEVAPDDRIFRRVDLTTYSLGVYHVRGRLSGSLGLTYQQNNGGPVLFPQPEGGEALMQEVRFRRVGIQAGGSIVF